MPKSKETLDFKIRNVRIDDVKEVYKLLTANKPYVGLNSRYTYFLLARDFYDTCLVALVGDRIIAFSSGYISPNRPNTFFSWEVVVHKDYRGKGLQKLLLLQQLEMTGAEYLEGTVNPSNEASRKNFLKIAKILSAKYQEKILFSKEDFESDGHEEEILYKIGPIHTFQATNSYISKA